MNPWIPFWSTLAVQALLGAYIYGRLSERVSAINQRTKTIEDVQTQIGSLLMTHGKDIAVLMDRKQLANGAAAGTRHA